MSAAKAAGTDALLLTHLPDVRYLSGFTGSSAALVLAGGRAVLFTDGRYTAQAKDEAAGTRVVIAKKPAVTAACEWLESAGGEALRLRCSPYNSGVAGIDAKGRISQSAARAIRGRSASGHQAARGKGRRRDNENPPGSVGRLRACSTEC